MRYCDSLSHTKARKVDVIMEVGILVGSNGGAAFALMRSEHLGTLEEGIYSGTSMKTF